MFAVFGRTRNFLHLLMDRILNFLQIKCNLTSFHRLRVLAAQELLAPLLVRLIILGLYCRHNEIYTGQVQKKILFPMWLLVVQFYLYFTKVSKCHKTPQSKALFSIKTEAA